MKIKRMKLFLFSKTLFVLVFDKRDCAGHYYVLLLHYYNLEANAATTSKSFRQQKKQRKKKKSKKDSGANPINEIYFFKDSTSQ